MERLGELTQAKMHRVKGYDFAAYVWLLLKHGANRLGDAAGESGRFDLAAPNVGRVLKAAVAAGTTSDPSWAAPLSEYASLTREFLHAVNAQSLVGVLPARRVPFQTRTLIENAAADAAFVAEGAPIPASRLDLSRTTTMEARRIAGLAFFTRELFATFSTTTAASLIESLGRSLKRGLDRAMLSEDAAGAGPAGLLNGVAAVPSTGATAAAVEADFKALFARLTGDESDLKRAVVAMTPTTALHITTLRSGGVRVFPDITATGGEVWGVPVHTTAGAVRSGSPSENIVALLDGERILLADDDLIVVEASDAAAVQMDSAPGAGAASLVSMFHTHTRALKFSRYLDWRTDGRAVAWMGVTY